MHLLALKDTLTSWHDGGVALFRDGVPICAIANERVTRKKYDGHAAEAMQYCLDYAGLNLEYIEHVIWIGPKPARWVRWASRLHWRLYAIHWRQHYVTMRHGIEHHLAHMGSAFYPSTFDRAAILSVDNMGDVYVGPEGEESNGRCHTVEGFEDKETFDRFRRTIAQHIIKLRGLLNEGASTGPEVHNVE
jgi:predicted NodU family carbamoyl transferase